MTPSKIESLLTHLGAWLLIVSLTAEAGAQSLINGGSITSAISAAGQKRTHTFTASVGQSFVLRIADLDGTSLNPQIALYDPSGTYLTYGVGSDVGAISGTAQMTGTYRVVASDGSISQNQTGRYSIHYCRAPGANQGGTLPNGGSVVGAISLGDLDSYTFHADAGENVQLRMADLNGTSLVPQIALYDPTGAYITYGVGHDVAAISVTATVTGVHTVVLSDGSSVHASTGGYELHFVHAPGANQGGALPNGGSVAGTISLGDLDSYTFHADAGENVQLRMADLNGTSLVPQIALYDPTGAYITYGVGHDVAAVSLTAALTGVHTVVVNDGSSGRAQTGSYQLHFVRLPGANEGGTLPNGGEVDGRIDLGDLDSFTFPVNAGEYFILRLADLTASAYQPVMSLYDPNGKYVTYGLGRDVASISARATVSGVHTVVVADGSSTRAYTGDYRIRLARAPGANQGGQLLNGGVVSSTLSLGDIDSYTFDAVAGEGVQISLADVNGTGLLPQVTLYDPAGDYVTYALGHRVAALRRTLSHTGTYTVLVLDASSGYAQTGAYEMHFARAPGANEHGFLLDGDRAAEAIDLGDVDSYTIRAGAGDIARITLTELSGTLTPTVALYDSVGRYMTYATHATTAVLTQRIQVAGTYTVVVYDGSSTTTGVGTYEIVVDGAGIAGNSGCSNEGPPLLTAPPSAAGGFTITPPDFMRACASTPLLMLGQCGATPVLWPDGVSCGVCGFQVAVPWAATPGNMVIPPLPSAAVGLSFCVQAGCAAGVCVNMSAVRHVMLVD